MNMDLFNELFGIKETEQPEQQQQDIFFSYRPEILKNKLADFLHKLEQSGASYTVTHKETFAYPEYRVKIICNDNVLLQSDLLNELHRDAELEAMLILNFAKYNNDFRNHIESHSIYYCHHDACNDRFYSDSLFIAILSELKPIQDIPRKERIPYDEQCAHWEAEYKALGIL